MRARHFEHVIKRAKRTLLITALLGTLASLCYWKFAPEPALLRIQTGVPTAKMVSTHPSHP